MMQTSETGMQKNSNSGFTFIELMVVIFIIGLVTTMVTVEWRHRSPSTDLATEQIVSLLNALHRQAIIRDEIYGFFIDENTYEVKLWDDDKGRWVAIKGGLGGKKEIPKSLSVTLNTGRSIFFYPSGEISAFQ